MPKYAMRSILLTKYSYERIVLKRAIKWDTVFHDTPHSSLYESNKSNPLIMMKKLIHLFILYIELTDFGHKPKLTKYNPSSICHHCVIGCLPSLGDKDDQNMTFYWM